jgi:hypothetical protein
MAVFVFRELKITIIIDLKHDIWGRRWLKHCAINRKVAGTIPDGVGIFH